MSTKISPALVVGEEAAPTEITATQLRLLPAFSPLVARFGAGFFRSLPRQPGVYLMRDERDRLIYVGKAKNLRQRLNSYRHPTRASRKTVRLIHAVRRIEWELCESDEAARLRENDLIRTHRPRFNRLGTWPRSNCFILMRADSERIRFEVTRQATFAGTGAPVSDPAGRDSFLQPAALETGAPKAWVLNDFEWNRGFATGEQHVSASVRLFGAFKPGAAWALAALLRMLWQALHQLDERMALPRLLLADKSPATFEIEHPAATEWIEGLTQYLSGESPAVADALCACMSTPTTTFEEQARLADLERLQHFFLVGPRRNRAFNQSRPNPNAPITQEELDDLMALHRPDTDEVTAREP